MKQILKKIAVQSLGYVNGYPTPATATADIENLIRSLHPYKFEKGLIRLGPQGDGGYLVPDDLSGIEACFSPGVGLLSGFEEDCARLGMEVYMADKSVNGPASANEKFNFTKKFVGAFSNEEFLSLDDWTDSVLAESPSDLMLQLDIEGFEYEAFLSTSSKLMKRYRVIVAEFHGLEFMWSWPFYRIASRAFEKILRTHTCIHIHPNNYSGATKKNGLEIPHVMEFTFIRNDRIQKSQHETNFPHPLDSDIEPLNTPMPLPECWYSAMR